LTQNSTLNTDPLLHYFQDQIGVEHRPRVLEKKVIPSSLGTGSVTCFAIEEGICAGYYDVVFLNDLHYCFPAQEENTGNSLFRLVFSLSQERTDEFIYSPAHNKSSLYSINFERRAFLSGNKPYKSVELIFSREWLTRNYSNTSGKIFKLIQLLSKKKNPTLLQEVLDKSTYKIAHKVAADLQQKNISLLCIKAQIFTLLNNFFQRTVQRSQRNLKKNQALYHRQIKEIEKKLSQYYTEELPNIAVLAKEFNISSSTLKRQFKLIFNKSIYHYYLEQKMALGFAMLEEKNASVSEIAYRLGYQKINSFSKIFKKHYGILPSQF
jgi:AraC-like DNA-binding protein